MTGKRNRLPENTSLIMPRLVCRNAAAEMDFCLQTFEAVELNRRPGPDGKVAHGLLKIGPEMIMIEGEWPSLPSRAPAADGSSPVPIFVYVPDVDQTVERAESAGAKISSLFRISFGAIGWPGSWIPQATCGPSPRASRRPPPRSGRPAGTKS